MKQSSEKKLRVYAGSSWTGIAQLSLVEHSLSPLKGTKDCFVHETEYKYYPEGRSETAKARVTCPLGFQPKKDELVLWGALAVACEGENNELLTSGSYLLKRLGMSVSGRQMRDLRQSIYRLGQASYFNERFYDPIRREHRAVGFGFLSHDLPEKEDSYRPWRISFDPVFFDFCQAEKGHLGFDLALYRSLKPVTRRMFHKLKKILYNRPATQSFDVRQFAINVLGCSPDRPQKKFNETVSNAATELIEVGVLSNFSMTKVRKGIFQARFYRGEHFDKKPTTTIGNSKICNHPLFESLRKLGLTEKRVLNVVNNYKTQLVATWADVTLYRIEHQLPFEKSPAAFFNHYLQLGAQGKATPPDWYVAQKKKERTQVTNEFAVQLQTKSAKEKNDQIGREFNTYLANERESYERIARTLAESFEQKGSLPEDAKKDGVSKAQQIMRKQFDAKRKHYGDSMAKPADVIDLVAIRQLENSES